MSTNHIKSFFKDQVILLTGGTGFVGKVLIEKLLRECDEINKIYVIIRPKKGKTTKQRYDELFDFPCFDTIKSKDISLTKKVLLVEGDTQKPLLGLSSENVDVLKKETTCVIHAAASVKFDQSLREATYNVRATRDLLELAKQMPNLKCFVYISTAFSNCLNTHVKEEFYKPPMTPDNLLALVESLDDDVLDKATPHILGKWPNTYVYTKSISEDLLRSYGKTLPVAIVRPAIVISSIKEPIPGWIDNFYGVIGIVTAAALGLIRSFHATKEGVAPIVPVDYVANVILSVAWKTSGQILKNPVVYNYSRVCENQVTWAQFIEKVEPECWAAASEKVVWYYGFRIVENKTLHTIRVFFLHTILGYIVDAILFSMGKETLAVKNYQRLNKLLNLVSYFSTKCWTFDCNNTVKLWNEMNDEEKKSFEYYSENVDWDAFAHDSVFGGRRFLIKDTVDTIPRGKIWIKKLCVAHYSLLTVFWFLMYKFFMFLIGLFL